MYIETNIRKRLVFAVRIKLTYSQAKMLPATKQAKRSSDAIILTIPATASANAIEKTKNDSLSIRFLFTE